MVEETVASPRQPTPRQGQEVDRVMEKNHFSQHTTSVRRLTDEAVGSSGVEGQKEGRDCDRRCRLRLRDSMGDGRQATGNGQRAHADLQHIFCILRVHHDGSEALERSRWLGMKSTSWYSNRLNRGVEKERSRTRVADAGCGRGLREMVRTYLTDDRLCGAASLDWFSRSCDNILSTGTVVGRRV